ncbi:hypothetical protein CUT44_15535 [Streptomyces carminius]|uniref:Pycsar effector protein domain-containing protein n=1 Tax=Streptomyces carminius TaxID=2665496 RepID=A0A2M8LYE5_9ACTN|nr:hypothetical protein CUT44_15535 [Streptomyces carminius]
MLRELVAQNQAEIGRADGKAAVLLAAAASLLGMLLVRRAEAAPWTAPLWWTAVLSATGALLALLLAVVPRLGSMVSGGPPTLAYFGDVVRASREGRLPAVLHDSVGAAETRLTRVLRDTSRIAFRKNQCIRWAVAFLLLTVLTALGVLAP